MKQLSFMAEDNRLERLSKMGDPLEKVSGVVDWEIFRPMLEEAFRHEPKGPGGRPAIDRVRLFKIVMLQQWYHIADDMTEYMINDRLSFQRFLGLSLGDKVPDAKTIWLFKERLKESEVDLELTGYPLDSESITNTVFWWVDNIIVSARSTINSTLYQSVKQ